MKIPILFIIFNRPDIATNSFRAIREYRPDILYIAADGPRAGRPKEVELCQQTRQNILDMIDWECEIKTLFRDENVGVDFGVYEAINWMFESEPWGIIIEDDCFLSQDFFHLCEIALPKYASEPKVMHISAINPMTDDLESDRINYVYYPITWGWATWSKKWNTTMDTNMSSWINQSLFKCIKKYGPIGIMFYKYWKASYRARKQIKPWDNIWQYSVMSKNGLSLIPNVNLAINNGIGTCEGSHYQIGDDNFYKYLQLGKLRKPYVFPKNIIESKIIHKSFNLYFFKLRWFGLKRKFKIKL